MSSVMRLEDGGLDTDLILARHGHPWLPRVDPEGLSQEVFHLGTALLAGDRLPVGMRDDDLRELRRLLVVR